MLAHSRVDADGDLREAQIADLSSPSTVAA